MKNTIRLEEDDTLEFEITDKEGKPTGEVLKFNMDDISLPLKYRDLYFKDKENRSWYKKEMLIINKKQDVMDKDDVLSRNQLESLKITEEFFKKETETYNMFLGENGVEKLLNHKPLGWESLVKIDKLIKEQIMPILDKHVKSMEDLIKNKYSIDKEEELI